jgi:hypothetical protein
MEKIRARIEADGLWNARAERELRSFWTYGIMAITNLHLRTLVIDFLEEVVPRQFFTAPASPTGKRHPAWQNRRYGLLRNTTECCLFLPSFAQYKPGMLNEAWQVRSNLLDEAIAATVISDTFKVDARDRPLGPQHGAVAAANWLAYASPSASVNPASIAAIYHAVFWHYGIHAPLYPLLRPNMRKHPVTEIVHEVDAIFAQNTLAKLYRPVRTIE